MSEGPDDKKEGQKSPDQPKTEQPPAEKPAEAKAEADKPAEAEPAEKPAESKPAAEGPAGKKSPFAVLREPVVLWSIIGGLVVIALAAGYVIWSQMGHHKGANGEANTLADRSICEATLDRVENYGVLPPSATLSQADPDKTQVNGRVTCHAQVGQSHYAIAVDVPCDDMGKDSCIKLYSVKQDDGTALFQRQM